MDTVIFLGGMIAGGTLGCVYLYFKPPNWWPPA